jgi:hypothetical protein
LLKPADVQERLQAVESEYQQLSTFFLGDPDLFLPAFFSFEAFKETFAVVLSRVIYLPTADCFALVSESLALHPRCLKVCLKAS